MQEGKLIRKSTYAAKRICGKLPEEEMPNMDRETEQTRKRYNRTSRVYDLMDRMIKPELRANVLSQAHGMVLETGAQ